MNKYIKDFSYLTASLLTYLNNYHPDLSGDEDFIHKRCEEAAQTFEEARREGEDITSAIGLANEVLYSGLRFSKFVLILSLLESDFERVQEQRQRDLALALLPVCETVFDRFDIGDDFEQTPECKICTFELIAAIDTYIHDHGLQ